MPRSLRLRYFLSLFVPLLLCVILGTWVTFYSHGRSLQTMQTNVEQSNQRTIESVASSVDALLDYSALSAVNLSFQVEAMHNNNAAQYAMYNAAVDQLMFMQLSAESLLNSVIDRSYVFLFSDNKVFTQNNPDLSAEDFYRKYFLVANKSYADFRQQFSGHFFSGEILPDVSIGFQNTVYHKWLMVQSIPIDPTKTPRGVVIFTLDEGVLKQRLRDGLADARSLCMLRTPAEVQLVAQGREHGWTSELIQALNQALLELPTGVHYLTLPDGIEYMVTTVSCKVGEIISAQPIDTLFLRVNEYNTGMLLLMGCMALLALALALLFTQRHVRAMQRVVDSISPEYQVDHAKNVFHYVEDAFHNAQEKEVALTARAVQQRMLLRTTFLQRLLRGELHSEAEILQAQYETDIDLNANTYLVLMLHLFSAEEMEKAMPMLKEALCREFGENRAFLVRMSGENIACLLLTEGDELRESVEAIAEETCGLLHAVLLVSAPVQKTQEIAQAYRQVKVMSRMVQQHTPALQWYSELFDDDALYNFEYSLYTESGLRNNIIAGNAEGAEEILEALYQKNLHNSVRSDHVLRFFAYDLYRLVNHMETGSANRQTELSHLRRGLDEVMENPRCFDHYFAIIKGYCLSLCNQYQSSGDTIQDETLQKILEYVERKYTDPELTVSAMADDLGMSAKYLSLFFKERTHEKVSTYIERRRMEHASRLLDTTEMTINDVAQASGYALTHTFRVAFKKVQGVTPLEWKKSHRASQDGVSSNDAE